MEMKMNNPDFWYIEECLLNKKVTYNENYINVFKNNLKGFYKTIDNVQEEFRTHLIWK